MDKHTLNLGMPRKSGYLYVPLADQEAMCVRYLGHEHQDLLAMAAKKKVCRWMSLTTRHNEEISPWPEQHSRLFRQWHLAS